MADEKLVNDLPLEKQVEYLLGASQIDFNAIKELMRCADQGSSHNMESLFYAYQEKHEEWEAKFLGIGNRA